MLSGWDEFTFRISSVPNKLRNMAESMALIDPIFRRNFIDGATNLERSRGVRMAARNRNILFFKSLPSSDAAQAMKMQIRTSLGEDSASCKSPMEVYSSLEVSQ